MNSDWRSCLLWKLLSVVRKGRRSRLVDVCYKCFGLSQNTLKKPVAYRMEESMWNVSSNPYPSCMKEEPLANDASASQSLWERDDGINVVEPVVEIKTGGDYLESVDGIPPDLHDRGGRPDYPYNSAGVVAGYHKNDLDLMLMYSEANKAKELETGELCHEKGYPGMEQAVGVTKCEAVGGQDEMAMCQKTGPLMFSHSILEPETSDPQQGLMSISDVSQACMLKPYAGNEGAAGNMSESDQANNSFDDRYRSPCPFCGDMFTHVIAHMMTAHSDAPMVAEAMSHEKGSPQRRALFIALKNKGHALYNKFSQKDCKEMEGPNLGKSPNNPTQKVTCKYCSRNYKAHKIRYHYMKCSAYKESTNHNTFTFRREMRKQDHYKKCMNIMQAFPFVNEKVASEILARMRQDKITSHILNDPLLLKYAEVHSQGNVNPSFLHKVKQDLRNLGKLILSLREKDDNIQYMADVLKPSSFGLVVRCVQEHSGFNSVTCSYEHTSTPMNTGYTLRKCTELLKEEALKTMDEGLIQQCNEFTDLMINDWKDCMSIDVARNRKREKLPLVQDIKALQLYFDREMNIGLKKLYESKAASHWRRLSRLTLGSIVLFNRGSSRKIDRMTMNDFESGCSSDTVLPELEDKLSHVEKQSATNLTKIYINENPGKKVPILLKPLHIEAVKLMNELRDTVGVVDNPFIFARPGGETPLRGDVIREFAHRAGLEQPNNITPSNLRKHVIVTNHLTSFPRRRESAQVKRRAANNIDQNKYHAEGYSHYEQTGNDSQEMSEDRVLEANGVTLMEPKLENDEGNMEDIKKEFNFRDCGNRYWFLGYNSSDFEFESGDDSDYEPNRRGRSKGGRSRKTGHKRHTGPAKKTEPAAGLETPAGLSPHNLHPNHRNVRLYIRGKTRYTYCKWSEEEESAVFRNLGHHFKIGTLPGKRECLKVMSENKVLQKRKWEDVKNFVRNKLVRLARTNSALQNSVREFCSTVPVSDSSHEFCETAPVSDSSHEYCNNLQLSDSSREFCNTVPVSNSGHEFCNTLPVSDSSREFCNSVPVSESNNQCFTYAVYFLIN
ncbi:uncharacterized protein [Macrobrachium rosenbergii]|uniref:uncharacterized protein isoform X4 n=1 Tax=Macrobrachium rosenbergii TaxID=79674 RepID=UPI0034D3AE2D